MAKSVVMPTAVERSKNKLDVPVRNIQTLGVNDARCSASFLLEKGDRININFNQFSRLSPLVAPTFGDFKIKTHAFWVPMRLVWHHYLEYFSNTLDGSFANVMAPINFNIKLLQDVICPSPQLSIRNDFVEYQAVYTSLVDDDADVYDLRFADYSTDKVWCYNLTSYGRMIWSNLQALGYGLPTFIPFFSAALPSSPSAAQTEAYNYVALNSLSIYPLLAVARVFYDWLYPSQYVTQSGFGFLFMDDLYQEWSSNSNNVLHKIFELFVTTYDRGFYTSLWSLPNQVAPNTSGGRGVSNLGNVQTQTAHSNPASISVESRSGVNGYFDDVTVLQSNNGNRETLTASSLRWLTALADYVQRNNIGGTRVREFMKSHFGFVGSDLRSDCSSWIRTFTDHVQIQDVTNFSSDNSSSVLGEQGGKGTSSGNGIVKFEANEKGFLLFVTQVVPSIGYYQGRAKEARNISSRFDLYNPDFDGVGMEGVPMLSLFSQYRTYDDYTKLNFKNQNDVFGFAPMYSEWKLGRDILNGDFLFNSRNRGLDAYHTYRDVLYGRNNFALDARFLEADNQSQRIFAYVGAADDQSGQYAQYDKIFNFMRFDATKYTNMKSLSESIPFFDEEGEKVNTSYEGEQI